MKQSILCLWLCAGLALTLLAPEAAAQSPTKKILVNGVELSYVEQGSGVPVIFVHGGLEDSRAWDEQVVAFSNRYHALA
jgi:hypothetical protein